MVAKAILILLWFLVIPFLAGLGFTGRMKENANSCLLTLFCGYIGMFAVFEVMALPMIFLRMPFSVLKYSYGAAILILTVLSAVCGRKRILPLTLERMKKLRRLPWPCLAAVLLIAVQIGIYAAGMSTDLDDSFYVGTATTTLETNTMFQYSAYTGNAVSMLPSRYVLSPFPVLLAFYGEMVRMSPAAVAHSVMPVFFVLLAYGIYALMGQRFFRQDVKSTGMFLCFLSLVHMFSYYSVFTQGTFLLIRIWQGKAMLAAVLLPALFYFGMRVFQGMPGTGDWAALFVLMTACCLVSSMGIMLAPVMLGIFGFLYGLLKKQWKQLGLAILCSLPCVACAAVYLAL